MNDLTFSQKEPCVWEVSPKHCCYFKGFNFFKHASQIGHIYFLVKTCVLQQNKSIVMSMFFVKLLLNVFDKISHGW